MDQDAARKLPQEHLGTRVYCLRTSSFLCSTRDTRRRRRRTRQGPRFRRSLDRTKTTCGWVTACRLTNRVRSDGVRVHSKERDCDEGTVAPEPQDGVTEFESSMVLVSVPLVEVDVFPCMRVGMSSPRNSYEIWTHGNAIPYVHCGRMTG